MTARLPNAALAARCTSVSWLLSRKRMGSSVSRPTGRTSFSVISANARAALRWRSTLSEKESVVNAESGDPEKKLVVVRSAVEGCENGAVGERLRARPRGYLLSRYCKRSATASRSFSRSRGSYDCDLREWTACRKKSATHDRHGYDAPVKMAQFGRRDTDSMTRSSWRRHPWRIGSVGGG